MGVSDRELVQRGGPPPPFEVKRDQPDQAAARRLREKVQAAKMAGKGQPGV